MEDKQARKWGKYKDRQHHILLTWDGGIACDIPAKTVQLDSNHEKIIKHIEIQE